MLATYGMASEETNDNKERQDRLENLPVVGGFALDNGRIRFGLY